MKKAYTLIFRVALAVIFAVLINHLFFKGIQPLKTIALAVVMLVLAYLFEYTRKRDRE